jgi:hypothetical protein
MGFPMDLKIKPLPGTDEVEVQVVFRLPRSNGPDITFRQAEEALAEQLNEIGLRGTEHLLKEHDSQGEMLECDGLTWTTKGESKRVVESPYGPIPLLCHVYQTSAGGATRVPLEEKARLISSATPRFARMIAGKLAEMNCGAVARDMKSHHLRPMSKSYTQDLGLAVAALITVRTAEVDWKPISKPKKVATVVVGLDGAHIHTRRDGWRQSLAGTIALYDGEGERLETLYVGVGPGETPPEGKAEFLAQMDHHIAALKARFGKARVVGLSDGAVDLQRFLEEHTGAHLLDFHHAAEYVSSVALAFAPKCKADAPEAAAWATEQRHQLRDQPGAAARLLATLKKRLQPLAQPAKAPPNEGANPRGEPLTKAARAALEKTVTYFTNNLQRMDYARWKSEGLPIGSGVTEAACKTLIKQRFCQSGMRWSLAASHALLSLRALYLTPSHWDQFWRLHDPY